MNYLVVLLLAFSAPFSSLHSPGNVGATTNLSSGPVWRDPSEIARMQFEDSLMHLYNRLNLAEYNLAFETFRYGMIGYNNVQQQGRLNSKSLLTIIDFTKPSSAKRFYTIDLFNQRVLYHTYVSHGKNTGENIATSFSNITHSNQSSLGFFTTAETYVGSKGYSLKLDGLEKGYNDKVRERAVVIHEADYVSQAWIKKYGRLGRSQGCPALPKGLSKEIINVIKDQTLIFAYYNDADYLQNSVYLDPERYLNAISATASARVR